MGAKRVRKQKCFGMNLFKTRTYASVNSLKGILNVFKA